MSDSSAEYEETMKRVWEASSPVQEPMRAIALEAAASHTVIGALYRIRQGRDVLRGLADGEDVNAPHHSVMLKKEIDDTLQKLDKNIARMVSDYARYIGELDGCNCAVCRAESAPWN